MFDRKLINNRYRLLRQLGQGGMGTVFLAEDLGAGQRLVALKSYRRSAARSGRRRDDELALFQHEFLLLSALHHPNLAEVYDFGVVEGREEVFFTSEFVDGEDLYESSARFSWPEFYEATAQICRGLAYIHLRRLIHYDVKPGNLLLTPAGEAGARFSVKLIDFGLASQVGENEFGFETETSSARGTPAYMAPEVGRRLASDHRSDLYSLGVTLFHCATRELPFRGSSATETLRAHLETEAPDPRRLRPDMPAGFADIISRLLEKDPSDRFSRAEDLILALNALSEERFELQTAQSALAYVNSGRFVGREAALNELLAHFTAIIPDPDLQSSADNSDIFESRRDWDSERSTPEALTFVLGEGGIGKSRLIQEFRHRVQLQRVAFLEGRATAGGEAYGPLIEIFRALLGSWSGLRARDALRRRLLRRHGSELSKILPELASEAEAPEALAPTRERLRLFDHMTRCIIDTARNRALVIGLHDLQHADEATAAFLEYFSRNVLLASRSDSGPLRLYIVASWREAEAEGRPIAAVAEALTARKEASVLRLSRLSADHVHTLLDSMLGEDRYPPALVSRCASVAAGNPYFVVELLRAMIDAGRLVSREGRWELAESKDAAEQPLPESIRELILERLDRLAPEELAPLQLLAVYGRPATIFRLAQILDLAPEPLLERFEALVRKQILDRVEQQGERLYAFVQDFMAQAIDEALPVERRRELHRRCGEALEAHGHEWGLDNPTELARHFEGCQDFVRALSYTVKAADAARLVHANERAMSFTVRALELLQATPGDRRRQQLLEQLAALQVLVGDYGGAQQSLSSVIDEAAASTAQGLERPRLHRLRGEVRERRGDYDLALQDFSQGLRLLGVAVQSREGAKLLAATGSIYVKKGQYDLAIAFCESGLDLLAGFPEEDDAASMRMTLGLARLHKGELRAAGRDFELSLEMRRRARNRLGIAQALTQLGALAMELGDFDDASSRFEQALELHETIGHRQGVAEAATHLGRALAARGDRERAIVLHRRSLGIKERIGDAAGIVMSHNDLGWLQLESGDYDAARRAFTRAHETNRGVGEAREATRAFNGEALVLLECGVLDAASEAASEALRLATLHELGREQGLAYRVLGRLAAEDADQDRAERLFHRALAVFGRIEAKPDIAAVTLDIVELFLERGDVELAILALDKLSEPMGRLDHRGLRARQRLAWARVAAHRGEDDRARSEAEAARRLALEIGDHELLWWSSAIQSEVHERRGERSQALDLAIAAMETLRQRFVTLSPALQARFLDRRHRRLLKERFRRLKASV